jgi:ribosomal protein S18 acetylase RimI-like enzyme
LRKVSGCPFGGLLPCANWQLFQHTPHPMRKRIYFKRHRMELDLRHSRPQARLPEGFYWLPWNNGVLDLHAQVKYQCFAGEMDSRVFPSLGTLAGCRELMAAIASRTGFCPGATWLVAGKTVDRHHQEFVSLAGVPLGVSRDVCVATVQGLLDTERYGGIQNLGVIPECRGLGLGVALLLKALEGFAANGARRAFLEVTAKNEQALRLYRRLGFRSYKTIYREVEVDDNPGSNAPYKEAHEKPLPEFVAVI